MPACSPNSETSQQNLNLPNPIIRSHYGNGVVKQYVRDHVLLRTEPASNNVNDYGCKKAVEHLPELRQKMSSVIDNFHDIGLQRIGYADVAASQMLASWLASTLPESAE